MGGSTSFGTMTWNETRSARCESTYEALELPDFREVEPSVRRYVASLGGYQKNIYAEIAPATKERLRNEWQRSFSAWGYPA